MKMNRWLKAGALAVGILALGGFTMFFMNFVKEQYLQSGYAPYTASSEEEEYELTFAWWGESARHKATLKAIEVYETQNPGVTVIPQYQGYDGYHERVSVQLTVPDGPDLFQFNPENLASVVERGQVVALERFVQEGILDLSNIPESNLYEGKYDGQLYGIPMSIQTFCVIYNKNLFDMAGVAYPEDDWTWQDYENILHALAERLPDGVYPSCDFRTAELGTMVMIHQQGGAYLTSSGQFNFEQQIRWPLELFQAYAAQELIPPPELMAGVPTDIIFTDGQAAMNITYNAMAQSLQADAVDGAQYGLAPIPSSTTGERLGSYVKGDLLLLINADSQHQEEAARFLNSLINDSEMIDLLGLTRGIPPSTEAQEQLQSESGLGADVFRVQRLAEQSKDVPEPRYISGWSDCVKAIEDITVQYALEKVTLDEAVTLMYERCGQIMRRSGVSETPMLTG